MDALLVRIAERITSGADPLLSPSEALELARLPESAPPASPPPRLPAGSSTPSPGVALKTALSAPNQRIIKRIPPSILSMTRIRCCAAPKSSPPTMSTASAS